MNEFYGWLYGHCRPPATVLEAGCGTGLTAVTMGGMGYDVTAIDKEGLSVKMAKRLARFLYPSVEVMKKDVFELNELHTYDLVLSLGLVEHFSDEEALRMLQKLAGVSRKYVVVVVPTLPTFAKGEVHAPILKYHNVQSLSKLLTDAGLHVVDSHIWGQSLAILGERQTQTLSEDSSNVPS
jgi:2-polyprenyl-3-methyl-5-hydroxy-6-metoxy-1,4-benzoquinol methylase